MSGRKRKMALANQAKKNQELLQLQEKVERLTLVQPASMMDEDAKKEFEQTWKLSDSQADDQHKESGSEQSGIKKNQEIEEISPELPKNFRQIGQIAGGQKVFLEDYVITYLRQMVEPSAELRVMILYGERRVIEDELCWFVSGAASISCDFFMGKTVLDEEAWASVNETAQQFFAGLEILGWAMTGDEKIEELGDEILKTQKQFFGPNQKLFFTYQIVDKLENLYFFEKGKMVQQMGYYIYYDRNENMQNYLVSLRSERNRDKEATFDRAASRCREVYNERKLEQKQKRSVAVMTFASVFLAMVIMVIGITLLSNYEKMENMEQALYQISGKIGEPKETDVSLLASDSDTIINEKELSGEKTVDEKNVDPQIEEKSIADEQVSAEPVAAMEQTELGSDEQQEVAENPSQKDTSSEVQAKTTDEQPDAQQVEKREENTSLETTRPATDNSESNQYSGENQNLENITSEINDTESTDSVATIENDNVQPASSESVTEQAPRKAECDYVIQKGDTLANICMNHYGNLNFLEQVCKVNHIENKDNIFYGQKILLP